MYRVIVSDGKNVKNIVEYRYIDDLYAAQSKFMELVGTLVYCGWAVEKRGGGDVRATKNGRVLWVEQVGFGFPGDLYINDIQL